MKESVLGHYICKIEGHGKLKLNFKSGTAKLHIDEGERLFEKLLVGRNYLDAPFITARICGVCPTAHTLASIEAIEDVFGIRPTDNIISLRKILLAGQIAQSHALHLYFLAAPDYLDVVNALELHKKNPEIYHNALALKKLGDQIVELVGGRSVHPTTPTVGGFLSVPKLTDLNALSKEIKAHLHIALDTVELFTSLKYPKLKRKTEYLATQSEGKLSYYNTDTLVSSDGLKTPIENYPYAFSEEVRDYSPAKYGIRDGHGFMVGALARLSLDHDHLHPKAAYAYNQIYQGSFPTYNSFHNNIAQAIEIVHLFEEVMIEVESLAKTIKNPMKVPYRVKGGQGFGAIEAPRGTLYHGIKLDDRGTIELYDIVPPTVQNLTNLEEDANEIMKDNPNMNEEKLTKLIEMLIRAYDPCITCAVH